MSHFPKPQQLICLSCGSFVHFSGVPKVECQSCGESINSTSILQMYNYAAEAYYYGHQYRRYYEKAFRIEKAPPKPSLVFSEEAFAWIMMAVLSGVIGNASYDTIKIVVCKILEEGLRGGLYRRDYSALLELSDDELSGLVDSARKYQNEMDGLTAQVREAIIEEIVVDTISHDPKLAPEMLTLSVKEKLNPKDKKKYARLIRRAIIKTQKRQKPDRTLFNGLWSGVHKDRYK